MLDDDSNDSIETRRLKRISKELEVENGLKQSWEMMKLKKKKKLAYKVIIEKEKKIKRGVHEKLL